MAMIAWEDRSEAGREALDHFVRKGRSAAMRFGWTDVLLWTVSLAAVVHGWAPVGRLILRWF
jgi:hypothetical protein